MSSNRSPPIQGEILWISRAAELATLRTQLGQMRAADRLELATLRWGVEYASELGASLDEQVALFLDFAAPEWLDDLNGESGRESGISELAPRDYRDAQKIDI